MALNSSALSGLVSRIDAKASTFTEVSDRIWDFAELRFRETRSANCQIEQLEAAGFAVQRNLAGIPTAFVAERGHGSPVIAFLGEFDALAGLSQIAGSADPQALVPGGTGHGCGHNLLGAGAMLAAIAAAEHLEAESQSGTIRYYGCPAEEGGSGKTYMVRAGAFEGVDAALTWHPAPYTGTRSTTNLATIQSYFRFRGRAAHAATSPALGRSGLDAVELMNMGANFMREHIPSDCRVHYAIVNAGGISPNVVQADADVLYTVRAPDPAQASALGKWLGEIAQGASLMTQTRLIMEFDRASSCLQPNHVIERRMNTVLEALGPVVFDDADLEYANRIRATLNPETIHSNIRLFHARDIPEGAPLHQSVLPFSGESHFRPSSTDVGDVSCVVPTAQCWCACWAIGTSGHTWQVVAQGKSRAAHKGMVHAAKVLSATALALIEDPSVIQEAKNELRHRMNGNRYVCPIPAEIAPPIDANSSTRSRAG